MAGLKNGYFILILFLAVPWAHAFFPSPSRMTRPDDQTHESITKSAVLRAVAQFFGDHPRAPHNFTFKQLQNIKTASAMWTKYYSGKASPKAHDDAVRTITESIKTAAAAHISEAKWTFGGERIKEGNQLLINLNSVFKSIMNETNVSNVDYRAAREKLGEIFLVLQSFYANTNWIPVRTGEIYKALGNASAMLLPVAPPTAPTCGSCPHTLREKIKGNCDFNVLSFGVLTSGYRQGQDVVKPTNTTGLGGQGKCSHGGILDATRFLPATGGINKGTKNFHLSPQWMFHEAAALTAKDHTEFLIVGEGGILETFGKEKFKKLFGIDDPTTNPMSTLPAKFPSNSTGFVSISTYPPSMVPLNSTTVAPGATQPPLRTLSMNPTLSTGSAPSTSQPPLLGPFSIGFAIDTTGSMSGDIAGVRTSVENHLKVLRSVPKDKRPTNYVLSTFNDPGVGPARVTRDPNTLLSWVQGLKANGGGDCPEMAMGGIELALQKMIASPYSRLYVFTDASAKDPEKKDAVVKLARDKYIQLTFLLTGTCGRRRKRSIRSLVVTDGLKALYDLAEATGGNVHVTTKAKQAVVLQQLLKNAVDSPAPGDFVGQ